MKMNDPYVINALRRLDRALYETNMALEEITDNRGRVDRSKDVRSAALLRKTLRTMQSAYHALDKAR